MWTEIRLLLQEQSDLGPHCLIYEALNSLVDDKNIVCITFVIMRFKD